MVPGVIFATSNYRQIRANIIIFILMVNSLFFEHIFFQ